jgi:glycosyltransferase involved in cell wall biosynthesis
VGGATQLMKILHVNDTYSMTGGISRYLLEVMELLEQQGHENVVIYQRQHERTLEDSRATFYVPAIGEGSDANDTTVQYVLDLHKPDIAFLHAAYDPALVSTIAVRVPTVAYVHGFHTVCPALGKYFHRGDAVCTKPYGLGCIPMIYARRCSDARHPRTVYDLMRVAAERKRVYESIPQLLVASRYMRDLLKQNGFDGRRIAILPYPQIRAEESVAVPEGPLSILYAGRIEIEKGIPYLLRAFARVATPCELRIAGDGTLRATYETMARQMGLASRVQFLGWLDDIELENEYRAARVVVMPSIFPEPFGQVGVQALLRERPVVAFDVGGISDWLKDEEYGYLVATRDIENLAIRIETLLNDRKTAAKFGAQGKAFAQETYSPELHARKLLGILGQVVSG